MDLLCVVIEQEQPDLVVPEVEAIATDVLADLEASGPPPSSPAGTQLTMNREGIRGSLPRSSVYAPPVSFCWG